MKMILNKETFVHMMMTAYTYGDISKETYQQFIDQVTNDKILCFEVKTITKQEIERKIKNEH